MSTLELHHGVLAGEVLRGEDDEGSPALVDAVHDLEGDELPHCPVSYMDAAPGYITVTTVKSTQSGRGSFSFLSAHHVLLAGGFGVPPPPRQARSSNHQIVIWIWFCLSSSTKMKTNTETAMLSPSTHPPAGIQPCLVCCACARRADTNFPRVSDQPSFQ